ncbi:MAG: ATP-dependent Clp protease ATP-binding subunit ClpX [Deltaproteobacteria bacterium]|nr:ATP-dependent Clp protease ATP-binding subunit ClpX [Deltaproteobacteria bacterium]
MRVAPRDLESIPTPRQIFEYLDRYVVGQDKAKRTVAIAAYNHLKRCRQKHAGPGKRLLKKSNILLVGPTGSGKTHIARTLAEMLNVPLSIADATEFTEAGYYGKDVEVMVGELLAKANHDVERAQRGIVFIDEIDKIARRSPGARTGAGSRDIGGEGVQQSLLKLLEGREIYVPGNVTQHWNKHDFVLMDTQDILFIAAGTFADLKPYNETSHPLGFGHHGATPDMQASDRVTERDLLDYGLIGELLGRLPVRVRLHPLNEQQMLGVLTGPPDCVVKEFSHLMALDGVDLTFTDEALMAVVRHAMARHTGARSLRTLVEEICHDLMFEAPERHGEQIVIDKAYASARLDRLGDDLSS